MLSSVKKLKGQLSTIRIQRIDQISVERKKDRYHLTPVDRKESPAGNGNKIGAKLLPQGFSSRASFLAYLLGQVELFFLHTKTSSLTILASVWRG